MSHHFINYPVIITKFQNLQIIYTESKILAFSDFFSRNMSLADAKLYQLEHKVLLKGIKYHINGKEVSHISLSLSLSLSLSVHILPLSTNNIENSEKISSIPNGNHRQILVTAHIHNT